MSNWYKIVPNLSVVWREISFKFMDFTWVNILLFLQNRGVEWDVFSTIGGVRKKNENKIIKSVCGRLNHSALLLAKQAGLWKQISYSNDCGEHTAAEGPRHSERTQLILGYQSSQVLSYYFYCEINPAWNNKKGWWGGEGGKKYIYPHVLFSPRQRQKYIYYISSRPPLSLLYAAILSACINSKRVCRALHRSLIANARAQAQRCNNDKDDCYKKRARAHRESAIEKWWRSWYLKRIQLLTSSTPLYIRTNIYRCRDGRMGFLVVCYLHATLWWQFAAKPCWWIKGCMQQLQHALVSSCEIQALWIFRLHFYSNTNLNEKAHMALICIWHR